MMSVCVSAAGRRAERRLRRRHREVRHRRLALPVRVRRRSHRRRQEPVHQGRHLGRVPRQLRTQADERRHQARRARLPLRVFVRARAKNVSVIFRSA